jgi:hypothetical protein
MHRRNPRAVLFRLPVALVLVMGCLSAEEEPKAKGKAKASEPAPGEFSIEWDKQKLGEPDIIKRLYRLRKSNQWEESRLPRLTREVIASGRPKLLPYGHFYQALIHGKDGEKQLALESVKKAIALGYANYVEIAGAEELASLLEMEEFKALIEPLAAAFQKRVREAFEKRVDESFASSAKAEGSRWAPDLKSRPNGGAFWEGERPSIAVVTRIDHEGFEKLLPRLKKLIGDSGEKLPVGVVFYTEFPEDDARLTRTDAYARKLGLEKIRHAVVGRDAYKAIVGAFLDLHEKAQSGKAKGKKGKDAEEEGGAEDSAPFHVNPLITAFFDREGTLRFGACGVLEDWQLEHAARKLLESSPPAEAPKEKEETPAPKEKAEEKKPPAEEPAKKEEPASEPPPEKTSSEPEKTSDSPERVDEP